MVSLVTAAQLGHGDVKLAEALEGAGWNLSRLATLEGAESQILDSILDGIRKEHPGDSFRWVDLQDLVRASFRMAEIAWKAEGNTNGAELLEEGLRSRAMAVARERKKEDSSQVMKMVPRRGKAKVVKWPTRLGKLIAVVGENENLRQQAEESERNRWIEELKILLREAAHYQWQRSKSGMELRCKEWEKEGELRPCGSTSRLGYMPGRGLQQPSTRLGLHVHLSWQCTWRPEPKSRVVGVYLPASTRPSSSWNMRARCRRSSNFKMKEP